MALRFCWGKGNRFRYPIFALGDSVPQSFHGDVSHHPDQPPIDEDDEMSTIPVMGPGPAVTPPLGLPIFSCPTLPSGLVEALRLDTANCLQQARKNWFNTGKSEKEVGIVAAVCAAFAIMGFSQTMVIGEAEDPCERKLILSAIINQEIRKPELLHPPSVSTSEEDIRSLVRLHRVCAVILLLVITGTNWLMVRGMVKMRLKLENEISNPVGVMLSTLRSIRSLLESCNRSRSFPEISEVVAMLLEHHFVEEAGDDQLCTDDANDWFDIPSEDPSRLRPGSLDAATRMLVKNVLEHQTNPPGGKGTHGRSPTTISVFEGPRFAHADRKGFPKVHYEESEWSPAFSGILEANVLHPFPCPPSIVKDIDWRYKEMATLEEKEKGGTQFLRDLSDLQHQLDRALQEMNSDAMKFSTQAQYTTRNAHWLRHPMDMEEENLLEPDQNCAAEEMASNSDDY